MVVHRFNGETRRVVNELKTVGHPKVAFVLSGGAALGASQVGMLRALLERGIVPDLIVGTSIGAWNGLWLAALPDLASIDGLERVWRKITLLEVFGGNFVSLVQNLASKRPYLVTDEGMRRIFKRAEAEGKFSDMTFEKLKIPLKMTATNILNGTSAIFEHGPVEQPLFASSAIPGLFPPVTIDTQQYVDGGLLDNGGVGVAVEAGAEKIYVLNVMYAGEMKPAATLTDVLVRSFHLVAANHVYNAIHQFARRAEFVVIEDDTTSNYSALDFHHTDALIASGYTAAVRKLDEHDRLLAARAAQAKKDDALVSWLRQPAARSVLQAVAWADVAMHTRWHGMNQQLTNINQQWIKLNHVGAWQLPDIADLPKKAAASSRKLAERVGMIPPDVSDPDEQRSA